MKEPFYFEHKCGGRMLIEFRPAIRDGEEDTEVWAVCENGCESAAVHIHSGEFEDKRFKTKVV